MTDPVKIFETTRGEPDAVVSLTGDQLAAYQAGVAAALADAAASETDRATKKNRRDQLKAGLVVLAADDTKLNPAAGQPAPTNADVLAATRHCVKALLWLGGLMQDAGLLEPDISRPVATAAGKG